MSCEMCDRLVEVKPSLVSRFRFCSRRCAGHWVSMTWPRTSSLELALHEELRARGIAFEVEHKIGRYAVDIAFPSVRLAVEADGAYWHGTPKQVAKDRVKDEYLAREGWRVARFSEAAIRESAAACVDTLMPMLARRRT